MRQGTPLLFWSPQARPVDPLATRKPLIVVPLDGRAYAERAIPCALAELMSGEVVLVHVEPRPLAGRVEPEMNAAQRRLWLEHVREARRYLRDIRTVTAAQTSATVATKMLLGEPGTALVAFARRSCLGALVMTAHSALRSERFFAGAVATQVLRQAPASTLLIPLGPESEPPECLARSVAISVAR